MFIRSDENEVRVHAVTVHITSFPEQFSQALNGATLRNMFLSFPYSFVVSTESTAAIECSFQTHLEHRYRTFIPEHLLKSAFHCPLPCWPRHH